MTATDYLEDELCDHMLGTTTFTAPTSVYVALNIGDPSETGALNPAAETTRVIAAFGASASGSATNSGDLEWTSVSTTETYSHFVIWDTLTTGTGNPLVYGALTSSVAVTAGQNFTISAGNLTVTVG